MQEADDEGALSLLHPGTRVGRSEGRRMAVVLAAALGRPVLPRPFGPGEREAAREGGAPGAWSLLEGRDLVGHGTGHPPVAAGRLVLPPRRDPRWSFEDLLHRPPGALPAGARVVTGSALGAALLRRLRGDLEPVRAGAFPVPEETPVLAEGPFEGLPVGQPLDLDSFVPAPGTGLCALVPPAGEEAPPAVHLLGDGTAAVQMGIEGAFLEGVGDLPVGAAMGVFARRKVSILFALRAVLFLPGAEPRDLHVEVPESGARQFARAFGRHLAENPTPFARANQMQKFP